MVKMESTNEDEIDEIVIAQADDDDAWEEDTGFAPRRSASYAPRRWITASSVVTRITKVDV